MPRMTSDDKRAPSADPGDVPPSDATNRDPNVDSPSAQGTDADDPRASTGSTVGAELFEAVEHFKNAAAIFLDRASKDGTVRNAAGEAEKVVHRLGEAAEPFARKLGEAAEPIARTLAGELAKMSRRVGESVAAAGKAHQGRRTGVSVDDDDDRTDPKDRSEDGDRAAANRAADDRTDDDAGA